MTFKPIKQINAIFQQEYFESTITWAFRVVLALNIPLIVLPLWKGFSYEIVWAAFSSYLLSLIDYRGSHYKKIIIQSTESVLIVIAAIVGMYVGSSVTLTVMAMFIVGLCAALIRNWSDYGSSIGVAVGFFFLFGISNPVDFQESLHYALYVLLGAAWAIVITILSFPFSPSNPVRRSVAKIWKANTDLLDILIQKYGSYEFVEPIKVTEKEMAIRTITNQSINLFARRQNKKTRLQAQHYDSMMELRKTASLFSASLSSAHEELEALSNLEALKEIKDSILYKTLSAFGQASARMAIVIFTFRAEDLTMAKVRIKRCEIAISLLKETVSKLQLDTDAKLQLQHLTDTLNQAHDYLKLSITQIEEKLNIKKSDYLENYKLSLNNFLVGLKPQALLDLAEEMLNVNSQQFKYALRVALGLSVGVFVFKYFNIDHGHWIALTMIIVIQPYYGATRKKGLERIIGTALGILLGGIIMLLPLPHNVFVGLLVIISFFVAYFLRNNYKVGVFFVTVMMVVLMQISQQGSWELIGWRLLSTFIGSALALLASYAFWPVWEKQRFPSLMYNAIKQNKNYLNQVILYFNGELPKDQSWHKNRRLAEAANNDVFACIQRMYEEPERVRKQVDLSFAKVGVSIRITREITALTLALKDVKDASFQKQLKQYLQQIEPIFYWVEKHIKETTITDNLPDFTETNDTLLATEFMKKEELHFIKVELEKIVFELETLCALMKQQSAN